MKAAIFGNKTIAMVDKAVPEIGLDGVLIKVLAAGICNTDIELFRGYYQFSGVAGHEFVGKVVSSPRKPELEGERVVADINRGCGACSWCKSGDPRHCPSRTALGIKGWDGAFAEYVAAPLANLHRVDACVADREALFAEPLAAALEVSQQLHITNASRMMVLGDGKLGLLIALALRHYNPRIVLMGKHADKLAIAKRRGVEVAHVDSPAGLSSLREELGDFDVVVEATGLPDGVGQALNFVRPEGTLVVKTTSHLPSQLNMAKIVVNEIRIMGSRCGDLNLALSFLKNKWVDVQPLIEAVYPFQEFPRAFQHACRPGAKKIVLEFWSQ